MTWRDRRNGALVFVGVLAASALFGWILWPLPGRWPWAWGFAVDAALLAALLAVGSRVGQLADLVIGVGVLKALALIWVINARAVQYGIRFEPFLGYKLFALGVALFTPSLWLGVGAIAASAALPMLQEALWPAAVRRSLPVPEPWLTVLVAGVALAIFFHRRHQLAVLRNLVSRETKAAYVDRFMRKFLAVRDLANSPLQSLHATLAVLRARHRESQAAFDRIERQIDRLHKLSTVLSHYQPATWRAGEQSFDPLQVLQQLEDSPTQEFDRLFLLGPQRGGAPPEGELTKLEQLLRFTSFGLEHSPVCAFWLGEDGRLVYVNQASCASLGYTRSELLGMHISSFAPRISRDEWPRRFAAVARQSPRPYRSVHRRKDGALISVEITASFAELNGRAYVLGFARELGAADTADAPVAGADARGRSHARA
jgi:PAS domain S-box-containing protein